MADPTLVSLVEHKAWCNTGLVAALRAAPADVERREWAQIVFTLDHTAIIDRLFKARLMGEAPAEMAIVATAWPDLDALARALADTDGWYIDYARRATAEDLATVIDFSFTEDGAPGRMTRGDMLAHIITHGASHRGAIGRMLETLGVRGASDMVTTFRRVEA